MMLQSLQNDLDGCMILMTDLIVNHHQAVALASYGHKLLRDHLCSPLLLANSNGPLGYTSKTDLQPTPGVFVVVFI